MDVHGMGIMLTGRKDTFFTARTIHDGGGIYRSPLAFYRWNVVYDSRAHWVGVIVSVTYGDSWAWSEVDRHSFPANDPITYSDDPSPRIVLGMSDSTQAYRLAHETVTEHRDATVGGRAGC